jgi:hypothetical protein
MVQHIRSESLFWYLQLDIAVRAWRRRVVEILEMLNLNKK